MHNAHLIKDRTYHLRTYRSCFVGRDAIDWLLETKHCESRRSALDALNLLRQNSMLHHVCDDHEVKDELLFYRFRRDDDTHTNDKDLTLFYKALDLFNGLSVRTKGIMRNHQQNGELYLNAFHGPEFIDYMLRKRTVDNREEAVNLGRKLLENDIIRHVTDDFHFRDDHHLLYQFTLDLYRRRLLNEVFNYVSHPEGNDKGLNRLQFHKSVSSLETPYTVPPNNADTCTDSLQKLAVTSKEETGNSGEFRIRSVSGDSGNDTDNSETNVDQTKTQSVLLRHASVSELESPDTPYVKQTIKIQSDPVGYGFVIRGDSPSYIQAVDPMGPAAVAGLKVRQYIHSVNGKYVLKSDHKLIGKLVMESASSVTLVVMTHKRDAAM